MEAKTAIEILENSIVKAEKTGKYEWIEACQLAIEQLKKGEPRKLNGGHCAFCGIDLGFTVYMNNCPDCGQRIKK